MCRRMFFSAGLLGIISVVIVSNVLSTEVRVRSLGGVGYFIHDETNIFFNPSYATEIPGFASIELGELFGELRNPTLTGPESEDVNWIENRSMGIVYHAHRMSLGMFLSRNTRPDVSNILFHEMDSLVELPEEYLPLIFGDMYPETKVNSLIATRVRDWLSAGLGIQYGRNSKHFEKRIDITDERHQAKVEKRSRTELGTTLGGTMHVIDGFRFEAAGGLSWHDMMIDSTVTVSEKGVPVTLLELHSLEEKYDDDNVISTHFNQRTVWELDSTFSIFQFFEMTMGTFNSTCSLKNVIGDSVSKEIRLHHIKDHYWRAGIGCNLRPLERSLIVSGISFAKTDWKEDLTEAGDTLIAHSIKTYAYPILYGGMETRVFKPIFLRASGRQSFQRIRVKERVSDSEIVNKKYNEKILEAKEHPLELNIGLGAQLGNLSTDVLINQRILFKGGFSISGSGDTPIYMISARYTF
jgi:hypothetical protein